MGGESDVSWENRGFGAYMKYARRDLKLALTSIMSEMNRDHCHSEPEKPEEAHLRKLEVNTTEGMKSTENHKAIVKKEMVLSLIRDLIQVFRD